MQCNEICDVMIYLCKVVDTGCGYPIIRARGSHSVKSAQKYVDF